MRTKQPVGVLADIKGILHVARRMILRKVQRGKIMPVIFDLRSFRKRQTRSLEEDYDVVTDKADRMTASNGKG